MGLTVKRIEKLTKRHAGKHLDGDNLYLQVSKTGGKSWLFRYEINGRERALGLGSYKFCNLEQARDLAYKANPGGPRPYRREAEGPGAIDFRRRQEPDFRTSGFGIFRSV